MRVRVSAVYIEDGVPQDDRLTIVVSLNKDGSVADEECFGLLIEDGSRVPFSGRPEKSHVVLDYGGYASVCAEGEVPVTRLNLVGKTLKVGDLFTRFDHFRGDADPLEYTYRIDHVG
ncbi:MAG: hypothetical protein WBO23_15710 [Burkholderiales bacterium]